MRRGRQKPSSIHDGDHVIWTAKIAPGQKQKFTVQYEVDAPCDKPIAGV